MNFMYNKEKRNRYLTIGGFAVVGAIFIWNFLSFGSSEDEEKKQIADINVVNKEQSLEEGFKVRFGEDLLSLKDTNSKLLNEIDALNKKTDLLSDDNKKLREDLKTADKQLREDLKTAENKLSSDLSAMKLPPPISLDEQVKQQDINNKDFKVPPPPNENETAKKTDDGNIAVPIGQQGTNENTGVQVTVLQNLISVGEPIGEKNKEEQKKEETLNKKSLIIPAGSFVKGMLLSGVIAPTMGEGQGDPIPSLLRVTGISNLPNFSNADIRGCFVLTETKGNLATETVSFRLKTLSCVKNDGTTFEKAVTGYVTGENGMEGLPGRVVSKQGAIIARAFAAEFVGGIAEAFEQQGTIVSTTASGVVTTLDPEQALQTGLFSGASEALNRISDFYMDLAENMVPVIEINSGRKIDIVFTTQVNFDENDIKIGK